MWEVFWAPAGGAGLGVYVYMYMYISSWAGVSTAVYINYKPVAWARIHPFALRALLHLRYVLLFQASFLSSVGVFVLLTPNNSSRLPIWIRLVSSGAICFSPPLQVGLSSQSP